MIIICDHRDVCQNTRCPWHHGMDRKTGEVLDTYCSNVDANVNLYNADSILPKDNPNRQFKERKIGL